MFSDWQRTQRFQKKKKMIHRKHHSRALNDTKQDATIQRQTKKQKYMQNHRAIPDMNTTTPCVVQFTPSPSINPATKRTSPTQNSNKYSKCDPWVNIDAFFT
jgi:hypothetical protein